MRWVEKLTFYCTAERMLIAALNNEQAILLRNNSTTSPAISLNLLSEEKNSCLLTIKD